MQQHSVDPFLTRNAGPWSESLKAFLLFNKGNTPIDESLQPVKKKRNGEGYKLVLSLFAEHPEGLTAPGLLILMQKTRSTTIGTVNSLLHNLKSGGEIVVLGREGRRAIYTLSEFV